MENNRQMPVPPAAVEMPKLDVETHEELALDEQAPEKIDENVEFPGEPKQDAAPVPQPVPKAKVRIRVLALEDGFIANRRVKKGDEFTVLNEELLGMWMKVLSPTSIAKRHEQNVAAKRKKLREDQLQRMQRNKAGN